MPGELKAKKLSSATLPYTWPKPVFAFKGSVGRLPVEAQPYVFVSRLDPKTGGHRVVPDMLYPIQANRQPVPKHQVLEDEYRAYHNISVNHQALKRKFMPDADSQRPLHTPIDMNAVVDMNSALWSGSISDVKEHLPELLAYNPGMAPPPGYMYRRFNTGMAGSSGNSGRAPQATKLACPPVVSFRGPFQNTVSLCTPNYCDKTKYFDSAVIGGGPKTAEIHIYNEPDAVSSLAVESDFGHSLSRRAKSKAAMSKRKKKEDAEAKADGDKKAKELGIDIPKPRVPTQLM